MTIKKISGVNKGLLDRDYVPYIGANTTIDIGSQDLTTTGNLVGTILTATSSGITPILYGTTVTGGDLTLYNNSVDQDGLVIGTNIDAGDMDITTTGDVSFGLSGSFSQQTLAVWGSIGNGLRLGLYDVAPGEINIAGITARHYLSAEQDISMAYISSLPTGNIMAWGGGNAAFNAATKHDFYTAADITTTTGTIAFSIEHTGVTITNALAVGGAITWSGGSSTATNSHISDNSQAHSDYLLNNASDTMVGTLTAQGFKTFGSLNFNNNAYLDYYDVDDELQFTGANVYKFDGEVRTDDSFNLNGQAYLNYNAPDDELQFIGANIYDFDGDIHCSSGTLYTAGVYSYTGITTEEGVTASSGISGSSLTATSAPSTMTSSSFPVLKVTRTHSTTSAGKAGFMVANDGTFANLGDGTGPGMLFQWEDNAASSYSGSIYTQRSGADNSHAMVINSITAGATSQAMRLYNGKTRLGSNVNAGETLSVTGDATIGDGGTTNYMEVSSTGDIVLHGSANSITATGGAISFSNEDLSTTGAIYGSFIGFSPDDTNTGFSYSPGGADTYSFQAGGETVFDGSSTGSSFRLPFSTNSMQPLIHNTYSIGTNGNRYVDLFLTGAATVGSVSTGSVTASGTVQAEHLYSTDDCQIDGDTDIEGRLNIGSGSSFTTDQIVQAGKNFTDATTYDSIALQFNVTLLPTATKTKDAYGVTGTSALNNNEDMTGTIYGGNFGAAQVGTGTVTRATAVKAEVVTINGTITTAENFRSATPTYAFGTITTGYGFRHEGWVDAGVATKWAFYADEDASLFQDVEVHGDLVFVGSGTGLPYGIIAGDDESITCTDQNTWYQVTFDTVGDENLMTGSTANNEIVVGKTGVYDCDIHASIHSTVASDFEVKFCKNNCATDLFHGHIFLTTPVANRVVGSSVSTIDGLTAADTLECWVRCTSAANRTAIFDHISIKATMVGG